jgi:Fe-S cluster assembly protein SufD
MTQLVDPQLHLTQLRAFRELNGGSNGHPWLSELRRAAQARFEAVGLPTGKEEAWRFTNVAPLARTPFKLAPAPAAGTGADVHKQFTFAGEAVAEIVVVNGRFSPELSKLGKLPRGVVVSSLGEAVASGNPLAQKHLSRYADITRNPFVALNTGFVQDGAFLFFPRSTTVDGPIHLLFVSTSSATDPIVTHPRVLVVAEDNVEAQIVESYVGNEDGLYWTNAVTEIVAGADCRLDHCKLNQESLAAYHVATMQVEIGRSTQFVSQSATIGGKLTRNDLNVIMAGQFAEATLNGLVLLRGNQHCDNHTLLDHAQPNCPSHELYKHVLDGHATGVFKGQILVRQPAQKTDSKQTSKSLLLSDDASMNSQPALEIYADDVKCTHGSTIGPVDDDSVFYLRSRGVSLEAARHLLTYAFAADITRRIRVEPVRARLEDFMAAQHGLPQDLRINDLGAHDEAVIA